MSELEKYTAYKNGQEYDASEFVGVMVKTAAYLVAKLGTESCDGLVEQFSDSELEIFGKLVLAVEEKQNKQLNERK